MFSAFFNSFKIPELRKRIIFTLALLAICRVSAWIPVPGVDTQAVDEWLSRPSSNNAGGLLGMYDLFVGGALYRGAVGAMGIMPYISASIIMQLMVAMVPTLARLAKEGDVGRAKITQYSRYGAIFLCLVQGSMMLAAFEHPDQLMNGFTGQMVVTDGWGGIWGFRIIAVLTMTTASMMLMWLGEQISARGIGNGVSLVITVGIVADLPSAVASSVQMAYSGDLHFGKVVFMVVLAIGVIAGIIAITQAQRKVPIQQAKQIRGQKMMVGGQSFMPLRLNYSGVMPIIFAQAILMFPAQIFKFVPPTFPLAREMNSWSTAMSPGHWFYYLANTAMIFFFSYFWVAVQFRPTEIAENLQKSSGYIPGIRPGQPTADFLNNAMNRITLAGAVFLTIIAVIPDWLYMNVGINQTIAQFFGGTSMLISVGVMLDTMRQIESQLLMRHYDGFLRKGRLRGRVTFGGTVGTGRASLMGDSTTRWIIIAFVVAAVVVVAGLVWKLMGHR